MSDKHMQRQINLSKARSNKPLNNIHSRQQTVATQQSASRRSAYDMQADTARRMPATPHGVQHTNATQQHTNNVQQRVNNEHPAQRGANTTQPKNQRKPMTAEEYYRERQQKSGKKADGRTKKGQSKGKGKRTNKKAIIILITVFAVILALVLGLWAYYKSIVNVGDMGTIGDVEGVVQTAPEFKGKQLNLLVLGIDYTTEDADIVKRDPIGQTDMILYCRFDFVNNTMKMMQIPRDLCVGEVGGWAGKINGVFSNTDQTDNRVGALAAVIGQQLGLPIDDYVTIDMEALTELVDIFGGIKVYVAEDMEYEGSFIPQGWQNLNGTQSEFFLRNRKQYATGDIHRLANQRYFYSALFRLVRTATWQDIVKLMPLVSQYINTDLSLTDLMGVATNMLKIPSSNIMICQLPVTRGELYNTQDVQVLAKQEAVELFNQYFNDTETPFTVASFPFEWPSRGEGVSGANVQWMSSVDADGANEEGAEQDSIEAAAQEAAQAEAPVQATIDSEQGEADAAAAAAAAAEPSADTAPAA